ncbi:hypothetical protein RHSIM_Rhsim11G0001400 [Rhododendron simsii]|uniref:Uncharacterized protein n=1 Tax=Rhododendron simsii TaxID=118357 RepID=A0A834LB90_RHOSS|nr:hypothetical protein RHSIM_Rhsim11G0001400 [Rhododendron simsii]
MSMSDSDTSSQGSEYRNFRQLTRDRLLYEMLRSTKSGDSKSTWKVLVMDRVTVKIMSYACKMADITEEGVSFRYHELRSVTETLATMQQNQSLLMVTVLALQKKTTTPPTPQAETEGTHPTGSQTETHDNQIGEGAQNLQSKETPTPPLETSS